MGKENNEICFCSSLFNYFQKGKGNKVVYFELNVTSFMCSLFNRK